MMLKRKWFHWMRKLYKLFLVTCILLAVGININLVRGLYSKDSWYISFFNTTKRQGVKPSRFKLEQSIRKKPTHLESVDSLKCVFDETTPTNISEEFRESHYMTVGMNGRLGNQMFKYASLLGVSAQHGYTSFLRKKSLLFSIFESQRYFQQVSMTNDVLFVEHRAGMYDCRTHNLSHSRNITLNGYFQSWKYFHHVRAHVRKSFQFTDDIVRRVKQAIDKFQMGNKTLIGVHVRRGDMSTRRELRRGYNVADIDYFRKVFEYFRYKFENPIFIVVSDAMQWARANLAGDDVIFKDTGIAYLDLAILAHCNHSIITSGTFGWWGAYLAGGITVYFKDYPKPNTWLAEQYNRKDYYPPDWIPM